MLADVNAFNRDNGWPEIEMGIALHSGEVVVGNIGSTKRSKYGVVGRTVNLTARIESFSVGGQILVSPAVVRGTGDRLILGDAIEVHAKGMREALICRELIGHRDHPDLEIVAEAAARTALEHPIGVSIVQLTEKHLDEKELPGFLVELSTRQAVLEAAESLSAYSNIMLRLVEGPGEEGSATLYAKVLRPVGETPTRHLIHFTQVPPEVKQWLQGRL